MPRNDVEILSTHYSVVGFLAARGIRSQDFSDFMSIDETRALLQSASRELDEVLGRLDDVVGARMCAAAGLPRMELFHVVFKYRGQYHLAGITFFQRILASRLRTGGVRSVRFYYALATSNDHLFSFVAAAARTCRAHEVDYSEIQCARSVIRRFGSIARSWYAGIRRVSQAPGGAFALLARRLRRWRSERQERRGTSGIVLLLDPGRETFFETLLCNSGLRRIWVPRSGIVPGSGVSARAAELIVDKMKRAVVEWLRTRTPEIDGKGEHRFAAYLLENASPLLLPLAHAQLMLRSQTINAAAWDAPLVTRPQLNLVAELLLCTGVPVLGRQHGANYCDQDLGTIHFDSDFNRCTHYLSYGFGEREFAATYPSSEARCAFFPAGNPPRAVRRRRRPVDIAFPPTSCNSLFDVARMPESELVQRQARILQAMEAREDLTCVVKPPLYFGEDDSANLEALRRLRHVRVMRATWTEYLARWRPRLVVFEIASTPLFEALPFDVDIFLMLDPIFPFAESALAMLKKRVHIFAAVDGLVEAIRQYGLEPLPRLRDQTYYSIYVNRGSSIAALELLPVTIHSRSEASRSPASDAQSRHAQA
jgi:hypothetical protein